MSTPEVEVRQRPAARVLLIDSFDRLLLFDTEIAYTRVWMTPGGGVKPDGTYEQAALREIWEETGLRSVPLGPCVWTTRFKFRYRDAIYDQRERYFVARVPPFTPSSANLEAAETNEI